MSEEEEDGGRKQRPFPRDTLEQSLKLAYTIQDENNGQPMKRIFIADRLKIKPESSNFRILISSCYKYGLTKGSYQSEYISLTALGDAITKTKDEGEKLRFLQEACQRVSVWKNFYQRYRDAKLPSEDYAKNLLRDEFKVPEEHVDECLNLLIANGRFSKIIQDVAGALRIVFETAPTRFVEEGKGEEIKEGEEEEQETAEKPPCPPSERTTSLPKQIFVAHGKNKVPLEQLKKILDQFKIPYKVAIEEPHKGRPISQKVAETMTSCSSAIFVFTADEEV